MHLTCGVNSAAAHDSWHKDEVNMPAFERPNLSPLPVFGLKMLPNQWVAEFQIPKLDKPSKYRHTDELYIIIAFRH